MGIFGIDIVSDEGEAFAEVDGDIGAVHPFQNFQGIFGPFVGGYVAACDGDPQHIQFR